MYLQSRLLGDKPFKLSVLCPQNGTAVLKGLQVVLLLNTWYSVVPVLAVAVLVETPILVDKVASGQRVFGGPSLSAANFLPRGLVWRARRRDISQVGAGSVKASTCEII